MTKAWTYRGVRALGRTEAQVRGRVDDGRLLHPFRDVYLEQPEGVDDLAALRAVFVRLPPGAALCRQSAAALHGFGDFAPLPRGVHVVLPRGAWRTRIRGLRTHEAVLPYELELVGGVPCTSLSRTAIDLARASRRLDALPVLDGALRAGATIDDLVAEVAGHARLHGVCQARQLLPWADPGAQCRQESQLRLLAMDSGLPRPTTQLGLVDEFGIARYYLDLAWERYRLGVEYDGRSHTDVDRLRHDRERHNWLAAHGWKMRYFTDVDLYRRPSYIGSVLRAALA